MGKRDCELCGDDEDCLVCQMAESVENFERGRPTREQKTADDHENLKKLYAQIHRKRDDTLL